MNADNPQRAPDRRSFLGWLTNLLGVAAALLLSVPLVAYLLGVPARPRRWVTLGAIGEFPLHETRLKTFPNPLAQPWDGITAETGVFVRYRGEDAEAGHQFLILAVNCAHLGCPVSWFPQSGLFMCPCHGGVYYENGERASGPPPRGLFECVWRIHHGELQVQAPHYPTLQDTLRS